MGSMVYAKGAKQRGDPMRFMISLETIKAFMITNTVFYRYPYYHKAQDTPDKHHYVLFAEMANGLFLMLSRLADTIRCNPRV